MTPEEYVSKREKREMPGFRIMMHPDADRELPSNFDFTTEADIRSVLRLLDGKTQQELVAILDGRSNPKVYQFERSNVAGTLRVVFAWGKGVLWYVGAFVKANDRQGERLIRPFLKRAEHVRKSGAEDDEPQRIESRPPNGREVR